MKVNWTKKAISENEKIVNYLFTNWNPKVATNYLEKLDNLIFLIQTNPCIGQYDNDIKANKILLVKQVYVIYDLINGEIQILSFWNNHQKQCWL